MPEGENEKDIIPDIFYPVIGSINPGGVYYIIKHIESEGVITTNIMSGHINVTMTFYGWERYNELKKKGFLTRRAFMAMDFKDPEFNWIFRENFNKAVKQTGFDLFRLDEQPEAGLIDNRMRVEIRNARFLLSDLSHGNKGAYFEAGFAEGLGKPVIYLCEKTAFHDDERKPHFDTNHQHIIVWDKENLQKAEEEIKSTIRNTLPLEAKMTDDKESTL